MAGALQPEQQQESHPTAMEQQYRDSVPLLKAVSVLSSDQHDETGPQAVASLHIVPSSPAAAAGADTALSRAIGAVWSSGVFCVLCAAFIFALTALLVKLTGGRVPVLEITLYRSGISLVVSAAIIKGKGITPVMGHRRSVKWLIPRGVFGATAMTTFYAAILLLPLADGMTLFFLNPCLTAIAAWAIRGEPLGLSGLAGCLVSLLGMVVLIHPPMLFGGHADWGPKRILGTSLGLVSAVCCAGAFISIRFIGKSEPAIVVALYFHLSTAILSGFPLAFGWPQAATAISWFDGLMLVGVAAGSFAGQLFMTRSLQLEDASLISSLNFCQVLYSYIFGIFFFKEHLTLTGVLGSLLVALGMLCVTLRPKDTPAAEEAAAAAAGRTHSTVSRSLSERARRLDSFKRLLSRARGDTGRSSSGDDLQAAEGTPLQADAQLPSDSDSQEQQQQQQLELGASIRQQQQQQRVSAAQQGQAHIDVRGLDQQQQQQQHITQLAPTPHDLSPYELSDAVHSMHHRHTHAVLHVGSSSSSGPVPEQQPTSHQQQQQQQWAQSPLSPVHGQHQSQVAAGMVQPVTQAAGTSATSAVGLGELNDTAQPKQ